jgi:hypothetical protein
MLPMAADENFDNAIIRGLLLRQPACDIVRIQDAGMAGMADPDILAWAAHEGRVLLTHDVATCIRFSSGRVYAGEAMPGLIVVVQGASIGTVIDDLLLLSECSLPGELEGQVVFIPFTRAP